MPIGRTSLSHCGLAGLNVAGSLDFPAAYGILTFQFPGAHPGSPFRTNVAMLKWVSATISPSWYRSWFGVGVGPGW